MAPPISTSANSSSSTASNPDTKKMYAFASDNRFQSTNLFEQQVEQLLKELNSIVKEKWALANNECVALLKKIFDSYSNVFQNDDENGDELNDQVLTDATGTGKRDGAKMAVKRFEQISSIKNVNELNQKLTGHLAEFESALSRLQVIKQNIAKLIENKSSQYLNDLNQLVDFNKLLGQLCVSFEKELKLKQLLIGDQYVFKSRTNRNLQVTLLCCFMHQPYLDEYALNKFLVVFNNRNLFLKEK